MNPNDPLFFCLHHQQWNLHINLTDWYIHGTQMIDPDDFGDLLFLEWGWPIIHFRLAHLVQIQSNKTNGIPIPSSHPSSMISSLACVSIVTRTKAGIHNHCSYTHKCTNMFYMCIVGVKREPPVVVKTREHCFCQTHFSVLQLTHVILSV